MASWLSDLTTKQLPTKGKPVAAKAQRIFAGVIVAVFAVVVVALTGCGSSGSSSAPTLAGCEKAMRAEYAQAAANGTKGSKPAACNGLSDAQLTKAANKVLAEVFNGQ